MYRLFARPSGSQFIHLASQFIAVLSTALSTALSTVLSTALSTALSTTLFAAFSLGLLASTTQAASPAKLGQYQQQQLLLVDNQPFFIRGGELGNSSASSMAYMESAWPRLKAMNLNTLLAPVYWELIEPEQGKFDFTLLDQLIARAHKEQLKLVLLWFGSWKNSMSCYVPSWIKRNPTSYPRAQDQEGRNQEILSPFSSANLNADLTAYSALLKHLRDRDSHRTVIMIQVENEIGMLPDVRDYSPAANQAYAQRVPSKLLSYLETHKTQLAPELQERWQRLGFQTQGTWEQVFGPGQATEEIFMAWHYARYTNAVAAAGKAIYPIPTYVNAALPRPGKRPGQYPSAGPLPHLLDIWAAGSAAIDLYSPDFYNPDFQRWSDSYTDNQRALFIPEHEFDETVAAKAFYAFGRYNTLGFSPFSIESAPEPQASNLGKAYTTLAQLDELLSLHPAGQSRTGVLLDRVHPEQIIQLGNYEFHFRHDFTLGWSKAAEQDQWPMAGGLIIQTAEQDFVIAGTGLVVTFRSLTPGQTAGIDRIEEGNYLRGKWQRLRVMNGDQDHQGRHLRIASGEYGIQQLRLYAYPSH